MNKSKSMAEFAKLLSENREPILAVPITPHLGNTFLQHIESFIRETDAMVTDQVRKHGTCGGSHNTAQYLGDLTAIELLAQLLKHESEFNNVALSPETMRFISDCECGGSRNGN